MSECNWMDCEATATKTHPDYPDDERLWYCGDHHHYIRSLRSGAYHCTEEEDALWDKFVLEAAEQLQAHLLDGWSAEEALQIAKLLVKRLEEETKG